MRYCTSRPERCTRIRGRFRTICRSVILTITRDIKRLGPFAHDAEGNAIATARAESRFTRTQGALIESGWLWAIDASGQSGWVPLRMLERRAGEDAS